jgi:hypothetical protein
MANLAKLLGVQDSAEAVIDERALVAAAAELLVPALEAALKRAVTDALAGLEGLTISITVGRKPEA